MTCIVGIPNPIFSYDHPPTGLHNASSKSSNLQLTGDSGSNAWWYCLILIAFKCKYKFFFVNDIYFRTSSFISRKLKKNGKYLVNLQFSNYYLFTTYLLVWYHGSGFSWHRKIPKFKDSFVSVILTPNLHMVLREYNFTNVRSHALKIYAPIPLIT